MKFTYQQVENALKDANFRAKLPSDVQVLAGKLIGGCGCGGGQDLFKLIKRVNKEFRHLLEVFYS